MTPKPQAIRRCPEPNPKLPKQFVLGLVLRHYQKVGRSQSNPVGTRSTKFSFKISPVSVGRSGFERVVLVWRWCSLVFEKKYDSTIQYLQQVICCFGYWFCLPFCCRTTGANFAMIFRCICTPPLSRVATLPGSVGQRVEAARYISSHLQRW